MMMKKLFSIASVIGGLALLLAVNAGAQALPSGYNGGGPSTPPAQANFAADSQNHILAPTNDPCKNPAFLPTQAAINVGATTTGELVAAVAGQTTYVCGAWGSLAGTTPSIIFKTGTKASTACDTGAASLSGTILPTSGSMVTVSGEGTKLTSALGGEICVTTAGTGSSFQGVISYITKVPAVTVSPAN